MTIPRTLPAAATALSATTVTDAGDPAVLDAVMLEPLVSRLVLGGDGHGTALLRSASTTAERTRVWVPGSGTARVSTYDGRGDLVVHVDGHRPLRARDPARGRLRPGPSLTTPAPRRTPHHPRTSPPRTRSHVRTPTPHAEFPLGPFHPYDAEPDPAPAGRRLGVRERLQPRRRREGRQGRAALPRARRRHRVATSGSPPATTASTSSGTRTRCSRRREPYEEFGCRGPAGHRGRRHLLPDLHRLGPHERPSCCLATSTDLYTWEKHGPMFPDFNTFLPQGNGQDRALEQGRRRSCRRRSTAATSCTSARARSTTRGPTT